jgi:ethylmalonyl-CoA/methylmalonyl-CoA decarboxylase
MLAELADAVDTLADWSGATLIVRGAGGFFCSGADLNMIADQIAAPAEGKDLGDFVRQLLTRLRRLPIVSVAAVEGGALGGGAELITACDHCVIASDATVRFVQASLGLSTGWGGGPRLVRLLGRRSALRLLGTACPVTAQAALSLGLADRLAPRGEAARVAADLLEPYRRHPRQAVRAMKAIVAAADDTPLDQALGLEGEEFSKLWGGSANRAALAAMGKA